MTDQEPIPADRARPPGPARDRGAFAALGARLLVALGVLIAPLAFGAVQPTARLALQALAAAALALAALARPRENVRWRPLVPFAAVAAIAAWGWLQSVPLPASLVRTASPGAYELHVRAAALLEGGVPAALPLSLTPDLSRTVAGWWLALAALGVATALADSRRWRRWIAGATVGAGVLQIGFGLRGLGHDRPEIWGRPVPAPPGRLHGTFVNPDHLALFLELGLAVALAALAAAAMRRGLAPDRRIVFGVGPLVAVLVLLAGIVQTGSRAGLLAAASGLLVASLLVSARIGRRRRAAAVLGGAAAVLAAVVAGTRASGALARWRGTSAWELGTNVRFRGWSAAWSQWTEFPIAGTGLGSFRETFRPVQPIPGEWGHLHNDPLELLVTTGLVGAALAVVGLGFLVLRLLAVWRRAERTEDRLAGLAGLVALVAVAVHSLFDFGLTMPANAWATVAILAAAAAPSTVRRRSRRDRGGSGAR